MLISLDTETTGVDLHHGCVPYYLTTCDEEGVTRSWRWPVDPHTRRATVPDEDRQDVLVLVEEATEVVCHNAKFDVAALYAAGIVHPGGWPWAKTHDTLLAGHVLASNHPHNLTDMALEYLDTDIEPLEQELEQAVTACRRIVQQRRLARGRRGKAANPKAVPADDALADWQIAEAGLSDMPSAGKTIWKADGWLPLAMADYYDGLKLYDGQQELFRAAPYGPDHPWRTALKTYADADGLATLALWKVCREELRRRKLCAIYEEQRRVMPIAYRMELAGATGSAAQQQVMLERYREDAARAEATCVGTAAAMGYDLRLPRSGNSKNLSGFVFGEEYLNLPPVRRSQKTGEPSLDKSVMEHYLATLPPRSMALSFVRNLQRKRKRDTAVGFLQAYERFWQPLDVVNDRGERPWFRLHPSLNMTGTDTLRWSSSNPNSQNISKQEVECVPCGGEGCPRCRHTGKDLLSLRRVFGPAPGREWYSLDAKNIELRLPFYASGEKELIELFERPDDPPYYGSNHLLNFHTIYPDLWDAEVEAVGPDKAGPRCKKKYAATWYQYCKNGGFKLQYGGVNADTTFRREGATQLLKSKFRNLAKYNGEQIRHAEKHGYVETMPDRTVDPERGYPLLCTRTDHGYILPTVPLNYHIQGTACWWMRRAMVKCQARLDEWHQQDGFDGFITMQIHDELVFDLPASRVCPVEENERPRGSPEGSRRPGCNLWRVRVLQGLMASCGQDLMPAVPTPVGVEYHVDNWGEGVTL